MKVPDDEPELKFLESWPDWLIWSYVACVVALFIYAFLK